MVRTPLLPILLLATGLATAEAQMTSADSATEVASSVAHNVQQRLQAIVRVAQAAARQAPTRNPDPAVLRAFLAERARWVPHVLHVAFLDSNGVVRAIGPGYHFLEGMDLGNKAWVKQALSRRTTTVSKAFLSLEGFPAVAVLAPVIRSERLVGLLSISIRPTALLAEWVERARGEQPYDVWVLETGGRLLYDPDPEEVGKNLLEDPLYAPHAELVAAVQTIAKNPRGSLRFTFAPVGELAATWRSATAAGTAWRVVVVSSSGPYPPLRTLATLGVQNARDALRTLAGDTAFVEAVERKAVDTVLAALARYYERYPCYAVQWVTPTGLVITGFPPGNALVSYQLDPFENQSDVFLLERVQKGKEEVFRTPLAEGLVGLVHLVPVKSGERLLGFVYTVQVE